MRRIRVPHNHGIPKNRESPRLFLLEPKGCGGEDTACTTHSSLEIGLFYLSIYLIALGNGGYQPNIATFGADQFEEGDPKEGRSKVAFFSYFYLALNLGSLISDTLPSFFEDKGLWAFGFWASAGSSIVGLVLFLVGTPWNRYFRPGDNPITKLAQVAVTASKKWRETLTPGEVYL